MYFIIYTRNIKRQRRKFKRSLNNAHQ
jgi:hypothetical protein